MKMNKKGSGVKAFRGPRYRCSGEMSQKNPGKLIREGCSRISVHPGSCGFCGAKVSEL